MSMRGAVSSGSWHNYINSQQKRNIILLIENSFLLGLSKGSPKIKMPFVIFFCVQPQIAFWALKRTRPFLLSLIRQNAHG